MFNSFKNNGREDEFSCNDCGKYLWHMFLYLSGDSFTKLSWPVFLRVDFLHNEVLNVLLLDTNEWHKNVSIFPKFVVQYKVSIVFKCNVENFDFFFIFS